MPHSYAYSQGQWKRISDPLKGKDPDDYGFSRSSIQIDCLGAPLSLYGRDATQNSPYYFYCRITIGLVRCDIWFTDLPDLFAFLKEYQGKQSLGWLDELVESSAKTILGMEDFPQIRIKTT